MSEVTRILGAIPGEEDFAEQKLLDLVYEDLHRLARSKMRRESGETFQSTELVHEAYLRLFGGETPRFQNRAHFFAAAAEAMRRILVERARGRCQRKRGGDRRRLPSDRLLDVSAQHDPDPCDVLAVHEALEGLEVLDPRAASIVKLRCFVGMSIPEIADSLRLSSRTVDRDWQLASAWLRRELSNDRRPMHPWHGGCGPTAT